MWVRVVHCLATTILDPIAVVGVVRHLPTTIVDRVAVGIGIEITVNPETEHLCVLFRIEYNINIDFSKGVRNEFLEEADPSCIW